MKALVFYTIIVSIIISLFFRLNPQFFPSNNKNNQNSEVLTQKQFDEISSFGEKNEIQESQNISYTFEDRKNRGDYFYSLGYFDIASNEYQIASNEREDQEVLKKLGDSYIKARKYEEAEKVFSSLYEKFPSDEISLKMVRIKIKQMNFRSAYTILDQIKVQNDEKNYLKFILDILNLDMEKTRQDLDSLIKTTKDINTKTKLVEIKNGFEEFDVYRDSKQEHLELLIARALSRSYEFEISQKLVTNVLKKRPDYRDGWILSGYNNLRIGNTDLALDELKSAYSIDPIKPEIQIYLGFSYEQLGDLVSALDFYQKALKNGHTEKVYLLQKIGEISRKNGNFDLALESYKNLIDSDKNNFSIFENSIKILIESKKDYNLALSIAKIGVENNPNDPNFFSLIGWTYFSLGEIENSLKNIKKSIELSGENQIQRNYFIVGQIEQMSGNTENAKSNYEKAFNLDRNSDVGIESLKKYNEIK